MPVFFRIPQYISLFFILCCLSVAGFSSPAPAQTRESRLDELITAVRDISSIRANFVQITDIPMFAQPVKTHGLLLYLKPDSLLWEYQRPFVEGFSLKNGRVVRWENSRANIIGKEAGQDRLTSLIADKLMAWVSLDLERIRQEYTVEVIDAAPVTIFLVPKGKNLREIVANLTITFQANGVASSVVLREARGGATTISFIDTVINTAISPAEFPQ